MSELTDVTDEDEITGEITDDITIPKNILVVDDEEEILKSLKRLLGRDYNIFTASSAEEGCRLLRDNEIPVVISDQRMPEITGCEFLKNVKVKYPDAIRLIITGYSDIDAVINAINEGSVFRYITKPWNPDDLKIAVKEGFDRYRLLIENRVLLDRLKNSNVLLEQKVRNRTNELEASNIKLSQINDEKNRYLGIVAHDLRNPIAGIIGLVKILSDHWKKTNKIENPEFFDLILDGCRKMIGMIDEILDLKKIESGNLNLEKYLADFKPLILKSILLNKPSAINKDIKLDTRFDRDQYPINIDIPRVEQVINNLISNAIKYSPAGSEVMVETTLPKSENMVVVRVVDNGQGIPSDEIDKIFKEFGTTSNKPTAGEKSTGLGLAICKRIVDAHKGKIEVQSTPGKGSVFTLKLPLNI